MIIVPYKAEHLISVVAQESQAYLSRWITPEQSRALEGPYAFSAIDGDKVLGCAGVVEHWPGRGLAWAYLDKDIGRNMVGVHRAVKRFFEVCPVRRIEAAVDVNFDAGHRWVQMLGFELETVRMKAYRPDGGDCAMYVRIN